MKIKLLKYAIFFICAGSLAVPAIWAQSASTAQVFTPKIPQKQASISGPEQISTPIADEPQASVPVDISINLEGLIWGTISPKAIIDGEIYGEGDRIMVQTDDKETPYSDAVIRKIDKMGVHVEYSGRMYTLDISEKQDAKRKRKKKK